MDALSEIYKLYFYARAQHSRVKGDSPEGQYWQGKKDALRSALVVLEPDRAAELDQLAETSFWGKPDHVAMTEAMIGKAYDLIYRLLAEDRSAPAAARHWLSWVRGYGHHLNIKVD